MKMFQKIWKPVVGLLIVFLIQGYSLTVDEVTNDALKPYFAPAKSTPLATDADGFLQRWLLRLFSFIPLFGSIPPVVGWCR